MPLEKRVYDLIRKGLLEEYYDAGENELKYKLTEDGRRKAQELMLNE